ncbi:MAG: divergent polysaccharide deacetylase family protein [Thermodesulfobacteriota bacterium]
MGFFKRIKRSSVLAAVTLAALTAAVMSLQERGERATDHTAVTGPSGRGLADQARPPGTPVVPPSGAGNRPRSIAVIIDDIGYDLQVVRQLARIEAPLAFAILPHAPHAAEAARVLHGAGKEILLHMPMEPRSYPSENPGGGALFTHMGEAEIRMKVGEAVAAVPNIVAVNNHMGSRFMEDETRLRVVMKELAKRGLFFVDSRTTPHSRARAAAAGEGVRLLERDVFLDHSPGFAAALANLTDPPRPAPGTGKPLVMIGHPHPDTVRALREAALLWQRQGAGVIPLSACFGAPGGKNPKGALAKER